MDPEVLELKLQESLEALPKAARAELLHVLMLPDLERVERIGEFWSYPQSRTFAELLIDCEEDRTLRAVLVGMLQEADRNPETARVINPEDSRTTIARSRGARLVRRSSLIAWLSVVAVLAACEPAGGSASPPLPEPTVGAQGPPTTESSGTTSFHWPGEHEENSPLLSFPAATDAIEFLSKHMDAEIALPAWVPPNVRLDVGTSVSVYTDDGVRSAQVKLDTEQGDVWGIMYGRSGLDGCDIGNARAVTVSGQPGLLDVVPDPDGSQRKWVQLVWPATLRDDNGVYGLFGWLPPKAVVLMAESMPVVDAPPVGAATGC